MNTVHIFEPLKRAPAKKPSILYRVLDTRSWLARIVVVWAGLMIVWAECGYPRLSYIQNTWQVCTYDAPAHEIVINFIKGL